MSYQKHNTITLDIDPFNTDHDKRWSWMALGRTLLNAAEIHAKARGFGMSNVNSDNYTWVLSRLTIEMPEMPKVWDKVFVDTWIENIYRLFTNRNFKISGENGKVFGYARSIWALIDYNTREPVNLEDLHGDNFAHYLDPESECPIEQQGRVRPFTEDSYVQDLDTVYADIDLNGHVNSIKYIEHIMNLFPMALYADGHNLKRLEIAYMAESYYGQSLALYKREIDEQTYEVEVKRKAYIDDQGVEMRPAPLVRCKLIFE